MTKHLALTPEERLSRIRRRGHYFDVAKLVFFSFVFLGALWIAYHTWFTEESSISPKKTKPISLPTHKEVSEKKIINPVYRGYDKKQTPYSIKASSSKEVDENQVLLEKPQGVFFEKEGEPLEIAADTGILTKSTQNIALKGNVKLKKGDILFTTRSLHIDTKKREGYGDEPVFGVTPDKRIRAGAFEVLDNSNVIHFYKNRPSLLIQLPKKNDAP